MTFYRQRFVALNTRFMELANMATSLPHRVAQRHWGIVMKLKTALIAATIATSIAAGSGIAAPWSPDGSQIVYSYIGGPENLYIANADGSENRDLVVRTERDFRPEWAPDGSHIVFTSVIDGVHVISRVDPDGKNYATISDVSEAAGDPDYSPDGMKLLYFTDEPVPRDLYLRDVKSGVVKQLTDTADFDEMSPRFAPDGRHVVFVGSEQHEGAQGDIWLFDIETGESRNLTNTPADGEFHPDFSNDGTRVIYIRVKDGAFDVAIRDIETGEEKIAATGNGYAVLSPHFSPDDSAISFTRTDFAEKGEGMPAIVRVSLEDGEEVTLTKGLYLSQMPGAE